MEVHAVNFFWGALLYSRDLARASRKACLWGLCKLILEIISQLNVTLIVLLFCINWETRVNKYPFFIIAITVFRTAIFSICNHVFNTNSYIQYNIFLKYGNSFAFNCFSWEAQLRISISISNPKDIWDETIFFFLQI